jgi:hypothetical protein
MTDREKARELMRTIIKYGIDFDNIDFWLSQYVPSDHSTRENVVVLRSTYSFRKKLHHWYILLDETKRILIERLEDPASWLGGIDNEE